jgi:hypothetical protein
MVVMNGNTTEKSLATKRFAERLQGFNQAKNVLTGETLKDINTLRLPANTALVLELGK